MNCWLYPVKPKSWKIIKREKVLGVSNVGKKYLQNARIGDLIVFYVYRPVNGIVSIGKINSKLFEKEDELWGAGKYPFRKKIILLGIFSEPLPLSSLIGRVDQKEGFEITPYLSGIEIMALEEDKNKKIIEWAKEKFNIVL